MRMDVGAMTLLDILLFARNVGAHIYVLATHIMAMAVLEWEDKS